MSPTSLQGLSLGGGSREEGVQMSSMNRTSPSHRSLLKSSLIGEMTLSCPYGHFWARRTFGLMHANCSPNTALSIPCCLHP